MVRVIVATDGKGGAPARYGIAHADEQVRALLGKVCKEGFLAMEQPRL